MIIKPSEETSLAILGLTEVFAELPKRVVNIVTGYGEEVGEALVKHPGTDLIALTGSVETGQAGWKDLPQSKSRRLISNWAATIH